MSARKFEIGKRYFCRSMVDYDNISEYVVVTRSERMLSLRKVGGSDWRCKIRQFATGDEYVMPEGRYSMAPMLQRKGAVMRIERHKITSREQWLNMRQSDITASVGGALFGVHEHTTAYKQWCLKTGLITADPEEAQPMRRGRLFEPVAAAIIAEDHPTWTVTKNEFYYRDSVARIGATPDYQATDPARPGKGNIQIKSVAAMIFRTKWMREEDGQKIIEPPLWIVVQSLIEASLSDCAWSAVAPIVVTDFGGIELPIIDIPMHAGLMDRFREQAAEFWRCVATNTPPPPDFTRDGELLAELHGGGNGLAVDLSGSNSLPLILEEDERLKDEIKIAKDRRGEIKAEVIHTLGRATFAVLPGWTISHKSQTRKAHMVKESTFGVLRTARA